MPPPVSSKSKGKGQQSLDNRRSRSRNTTPVPAKSAQVQVKSEPNVPPYLPTSFAQTGSNVGVTIEEVLERHGNGSGLPHASNISTMADTIKSQFLPLFKARGEACDRAMRELSKLRKERMEQQRERDRVSRENEERHKVKKAAKPKADDERPLAVGAHGVARQDGVDVHNDKDASSDMSSPISQPPHSATFAPPEARASPSDSESPHQPPPAPMVPQFQTFGPDPSKFDDPTVYHIRDLTPDMTEQEKKQILCVSEYPASDLVDLTCGTPPDKDFSNAKPANQVNAGVFANYVEPYVKPLTEEDIAFLKERSDRTGPFVMPKRGNKYYKDIWNEEDDTSMRIDTKLDKNPPNEARGDMDMMADDVAERPSDVSTGPVLARLLATMRPENRNTTNGETNGLTNGDMDIDGETNGEPHINGNAEPQPSATYVPESQNTTWKNQTVPPPDFAQLDERIMEELRHIGFIGEDEAPNTSGTHNQYDERYDDDVAARLRYLQNELRYYSILNGARKARILELTEERMAMQEYNTIADDLDTQLNQAYLKRNRNIGKGKKNPPKPKPGVAVPSGASAAAAGGVSKPGVGEPIRLLMHRKNEWNNIIGPVVNYGMASIPEQSIFGEERMKRLLQRESDSWAMEVDEGQ